MGKLTAKTSKICPDCNKVRIHITTKRCRSCYEANRKLLVFYCVDCGKKVSNYVERCVSCAGINNTGELNSRWNGPKKKSCPDCGKEIQITSKFCYSCSKKGDRHADIKGIKNPNYGNGQIMQGRNNPNWQGGIKHDPYGKEFNSTLRSQIRERDGNRCRMCGCSGKDLKRKLHIHHIDYDKQNNDPSNLISLCVHCHVKTNYQRVSWQGYFLDKGATNDFQLQI